MYATETSQIIGADCLELVTEAPKFKVGDMVRGISETKYAITNTGMTKGEVTKVNLDATKIWVKALEFDNKPFYGSLSYDVEPEYFELLPTFPKIHHKGSLKIVFNPPYTVVIDKINDRTAKAKCKASDEFDETKGLAIALLRLIDPDEDVSWICGK